MPFSIMQTPSRAAECTKMGGDEIATEHPEHPDRLDHPGEAKPEQLVPEDWRIPEDPLSLIEKSLIRIKRAAEVQRRIGNQVANLRVSARRIRPAHRPISCRLSISDVRLLTSHSPQYTEIPVPSNLTYHILPSPRLTWDPIPTTRTIEFHVDIAIGDPGSSWARLYQGSESGPEVWKLECPLGGDPAPTPTALKSGFSLPPLVRSQST
ncbi:hypothetical protein PAPYR_10917 [Paratrimastix pyriformis]|uniref:Uncharacterized protein n=1 Tax=Paratrimastix pyriformis TaxID=342808 RepID=A0ABQ8U4U0_9EUKA|nr:hypothetical protein PAPYR_10917 [Paratrimastix pyriformis]